MRRDFLIRCVIAVAFGLVLIPPVSTPAYDDYIYNNLMKSRDALKAQQAELQRAYDETSQKLDRIDKYLKQVNSSLRDVDEALRSQGR